MKLYHSPGACSLGIHVLLEETGRPFELVPISLRDGEQKMPDYLALNPKAKVPALLRDNGRMLTEFPAIAVYLARTNPASRLLSEDPEVEAQALEMMEYIVATVHMQAFSRVGRPANFSLSEGDTEQVKARGRELYANGMNLLDRSLQDREYAVGEAFSVADAALIFVENWAPRAEYTLPANLSGHFARMKARPAVQRAFTAEGLAL